MKNFVQRGDTVSVTVAWPVEVGTLVTAGSLIGVAAYSAAGGTPVEIATRGVFELPKIVTDDIAQGELLYYAAATNNLTNAAGAGSKPLVGVAVAAAGNGVASVRCLLMLTGQTGPA